MSPSTKSITWCETREIPVLSVAVGDSLMIMIMIMCTRATEFTMCLNQNTQTRTNLQKFIPKLDLLGIQSRTAPIVHTVGPGGRQEKRFCYLCNLFNNSTGHLFFIVLNSDRI